jgi:hypothetical protein
MDTMDVDSFCLVRTETDSHSPIGMNSINRIGTRDCRHQFVRET